MDVSKQIKQKALEIGFDLVGVTDASPIDAGQIEMFNSWLADGFAGDMEYMNRNLDKRTNPAKLLENAKSVIVAGLNYTIQPQNVAKANQPVGKVANFAQYEDYHHFIRKLLEKLVTFINSIVKEKFEFKICVDSVPIAERALAWRAGLGFIGKNHMLTNPSLGNQLLLGEIVTTLELQADKPISKSCSDCRKCIETCPTKALLPDGRFDAAKCISYLTIEFKGQISSDLGRKIGNRIFGCDECAMACPYQKNAPVCKNKIFKFYKDKSELNLNEIMDLDEKGFEEKFADSPINRLRLDRLKRNAKICLANTEKTATDYQD